MSNCMIIHFLIEVVFFVWFAVLKSVLPCIFASYPFVFFFFLNAKLFFVITPANVIVRVWIYELAPVNISSFDSSYYYFGGSYICCNGNIMYIAETQQFIGYFISAGFDWRISEENYNVNFIIWYTGSNLLNTAVGTRKKAFYLKTGRLWYNFTCFTCCTDFLLTEYSAVCYAELI